MMDFSRIPGNTAAAEKERITSGPCDWCGSLILVSRGPSGRETKFEPLFDDEKRLLRAYDGNLITGSPHSCRVRCSACATLVIFESGNLFERSNDGVERRPHQCPESKVR